MNSIRECKGRGPINIALIKYWGKEDEENIIPLNNSISITLDTSQLYTETHIIADVSDQTSSCTLEIGGELVQISKRVGKIIQFFRDRTKDVDMKAASLRIISHNTFPTAAGCASSASSMSCLVMVLEGVFQCGLTKHELSALARLGSGSACRSIFSGVVEWVKCSEEHNNESIAVQVLPAWDELKVLLLIVNEKRKDTSSTDGMKRSKETSPFLSYRVEHVLPQRIKEMKEAIGKKDFNAVAEITMKDSNNFHAVCRDTYPPIDYMTDTSNFIIKCVEKINSLNPNEITCAYTFDAGANAFILVQEKNMKLVEGIFSRVFDLSSHTQGYDTSVQDLINFLSFQRIMINAELKRIISFSVGEGAKII